VADVETFDAELSDVHAAAASLRELEDKLIAMQERASLNATQLEALSAQLEDTVASIGGAAEDLEGFSAD
jgi:hypothetical protein